MPNETTQTPLPEADLIQNTLAIEEIVERESALNRKPKSAESYLIQPIQGGIPCRVIVDGGVRIYNEFGGRIESPALDMAASIDLIAGMDRLCDAASIKKAHFIAEIVDSKQVFITDLLQLNSKDLSKSPCRDRQFHLGLIKQSSVGRASNVTIHVGLPAIRFLNRVMENNEFCAGFTLKDCTAPFEAPQADSLIEHRFVNGSYARISEANEDGVAWLEALDETGTWTSIGEAFVINGISVTAGDIVQVDYTRYSPEDGLEGGLIQTPVRADLDETACRRANLTNERGSVNGHHQNKVVDAARAAARRAYAFKW